MRILESKKVENIGVMTFVHGGYLFFIFRTIFILYFIPEMFGGPKYGGTTHYYLLGDLKSMSMFIFTFSFSGYPVLYLFHFFDNFHDQTHSIL